MYLCTRFDTYCAGKNANNALKKNDLTFSLEEVNVSFRCML